jgi:hypothetical protein
VRKLATALGAILALQAGWALSQGIAVRPQVKAPLLTRPITITVPVEVRNYPTNLASSGSPALEVVCEIRAFNPALNIWAQSVSKGSTMVPFVPAPGNDSYQGSVDVHLTLPGGTLKPKWICYLLKPPFPSSVHLDPSATIQEVEGYFAQ